MNKYFLRSSFRHRDINVTDVDDQLTLTEELGNLIKQIDKNIIEKKYISLDNHVETYNTDINDNRNMSTLNEVENDEEKYETHDPKKNLTPQIGNLHKALAAVNDVHDCKEILMNIILHQHITNLKSNLNKIFHLFKKILDLNESKLSEL